MFYFRANVVFFTPTKVMNWANEETYYTCGLHSFQKSAVFL